MADNTGTLTAMSMREKLRAPLFAVSLAAGLAGGYALNEVVINPQPAVSEEQDGWADEAWALYGGAVAGFMVSSIIYLAWQHRDLQNRQVTISQAPTPIEPELEKL